MTTYLINNLREELFFWFMVLNLSVIHDGEVIAELNNSHWREKEEEREGGQRKKVERERMLRAKMREHACLH